MAFKILRQRHRWRKRCPKCKKLRRFGTGDTNSGGEHHANPGWYNVKGGLICGWCWLRDKGADTFSASDESGNEKTRDTNTGRVLSVRKRD